MSGRGYNPLVKTKGHPGSVCPRDKRKTKDLKPKTTAKRQLEDTRETLLYRFHSNRCVKIENMDLLRANFKNVSR